MAARGQKTASAALLGLRALGAALTVACCVFVARGLADRWDGVRGHLDSGSFVLAVVGCVALWALLNVSLGIGWAQLVRMGGARIGYWGSIRLSLRTQVGKYLPGNVFHYVGRVALAAEDGVGKRPAALATALEAALLLALAGLFSVGLLLQAFGGLGLALAALTGAATLYFARAWLARLWGGPFEAAGWNLGSLIKAAAAYAFVFVLQGAMFLWIEHSLYGLEGVSLGSRLELVASSWAAGFAAIGSPGGIGVREAVVALLAEGEAEQTRFLAVAAAMRLCSILGDGLSLPLGLLMKAEKTRHG